MSQSIDIFHLRQIQAAYKAGYDKCREEMGDLPEYYSQNFCHKKYGQRTVKRWIEEGLVDVIKDGPGNCRCRIRREQVELVASQSNRASYYENHM